MIYTLTANPAIDYNIACDGLSANTVKIDGVASGEIGNDRVNHVRS